MAVLASKKVNAMGLNRKSEVYNDIGVIVVGFVPATCAQHLVRLAGGALPFCTHPLT